MNEVRTTRETPTAEGMAARLHTMFAGRTLSIPQLRVVTELSANGPSPLAFNVAQISAIHIATVVSKLNGRTPPAPTGSQIMFMDRILDITNEATLALMVGLLETRQGKTAVEIVELALEAMEGFNLVEILEDDDIDGRHLDIITQLYVNGTEHTPYEATDAQKAEAWQTNISGRVTGGIAPPLTLDQMSLIEEILEIDGEEEGDQLEALIESLNIRQGQTAVEVVAELLPALQDVADARAEVERLQKEIARPALEAQAAARAVAVARAIAAAGQSAPVQATAALAAPAASTGTANAADPADSDTWFGQGDEKNGHAEKALAIGQVAERLDKLTRTVPRAGRGVRKAEFQASAAALEGGGIYVGGKSYLAKLADDSDELNKKQKRYLALKHLHTLLADPETLGTEELDQLKTEMKAEGLSFQLLNADDTVSIEGWITYIEDILFGEYKYLSLRETQALLHMLDPETYAAKVRVAGRGGIHMN